MICFSIYNWIYVWVNVWIIFFCIILDKLAATDNDNTTVVI